MKNPYTYFGETLTPGIARELIQELFTGRIVQKQEMMRVVDETHRERGGEPSAAKYQHPVTLALLRMKREGHADNPSQGNWFIPSTSQDDESIDLEIINFYQYQNLRVTGSLPGEGQLVLTAQDGSERIIAEFAEFEEAFNLFEDIRDALEAGETYYSLE